MAEGEKERKTEIQKIEYLIFFIIIGEKIKIA